MSSKQDYFKKVLHLRLLCKKQNPNQLAIIMARIPLMIQKYEILPNLCYLLIYSIIKPSTRTALQFNINKDQIEQIQVQIEETDHNNTFVENFMNNMMIISGKKNGKRFDIASKDRVQKYEMLCSRHLHRTIFNEQDKVFIVSGRNEQQQKSLSCEVFSLISKNFAQIKDIPEGKQTFGIALTPNNRIYVIGGQDSNTICCYNQISDEWEVLLNKTHDVGSMTAGYSLKHESIFFWDNGGNLKGTWIYDQEQLKEHGNQQPQVREWIFCRPLVMEAQIYVYDYYCSLDMYDIRKADWTKPTKDIQDQIPKHQFQSIFNKPTQAKQVQSFVQITKIICFNNYQQVTLVFTLSL